MSPPRALISLALACACTQTPEVVVVATRELGEVAEVEGIAARERGTSVFAFARSIWLFGETTLAGPDDAGELRRANTWSQTPDLGAKDGVDLFETATDELGGPAELLPYTAEELAFNQSNGDERLVLWPLTAIRDDPRDRVLLFYAKLRRAGPGSFSRIGSSLAVWTELEFGPVRPVLDAGSDEPTLLFEAPDPEFGQAAVIVGEHLFAFACSDALYHPCTLARVELDAAFERGAWRFWTGREWSEALDEAVTVVEAAPILSVSRNHHVDRYLAIYADGDRVLLRSATAPEGPWSTATPVLAGAAMIDHAVAHPEYRRGGGQFEYLSYRSGGQRRLVEVELGLSE